MKATANDRVSEKRPMFKHTWITINFLGKFPVHNIITNELYHHEECHRTQIFSLTRSFAVAFIQFYTMWYFMILQIYCTMIIFMILVCIMIFHVVYKWMKLKVNEWMSENVHHYVYMYKYWLSWLVSGAQLHVLCMKVSSDINTASYHQFLVCNQRAKRKCMW